MVRAGWIIANGLLAGLVYLVAQAIDLAYTGNKVDDRVLLGSLTSVPPARVKLSGISIHLVNSIAASAVFVVFAAPRMTGPSWLRGVVFASLENFLLYPIVLLEDRHPAIRDGRLGSYQTKSAFLQGMWRHFWFGAALGITRRCHR